MAVRTSLISDLDGFKQLETEWTALAAQLEFPQVFYRWDWNWLSFRWFREGCSPFILVAKEHGSTVGIAPLCLVPTKTLGVRVRLLEPIAARCTDYSTFLIRRGEHRRRIVKAMLNALCEHRREWDVLNLVEFSSRDSTTVQIMSAIADFPELNCQPLVASRTPYIDCKSYPASSDLKQITWLVQRRTKLAEAGFTFEVGAAASDEFWKDFWRLRDQRWTGRSDSERSFFEEVRSLFEPLNLLECSVARYRGGPVAMHFGFRDERKIYYYRPIFDMNYREHRVGAVLANEIVQTYLQSHIEIDLMRGDEAYKFWWTDKISVNYRFIIGWCNSPAALAYNLAPAVHSFKSNLGAPRYAARRLRSLVSPVKAHKVISNG